MEDDTFSDNERTHDALIITQVTRPFHSGEHYEIIGDTTLEICVIFGITQAFVVITQYKKMYTKQYIYVGTVLLSPKCLKIHIYTKIFKIKSVSIYSKYTSLQLIFQCSNYI